MVAAGLPAAGEGQRQPVPAVARIGGEPRGRPSATISKSGSGVAHEVGQARIRRARSALVPAVPRASARPAASPHCGPQAIAGTAGPGARPDQVGPGVEVEVRGHGAGPAARRRTASVPRKRSRPAGRAVGFSGDHGALRRNGDQVGAAVLVEVGHEQAGDASARLCARHRDAWNRPRRSLRTAAERLAVGGEDEVEVAIVVESSAAIAVFGAGRRAARRRRARG